MRQHQLRTARTIFVKPQSNHIFEQPKRAEDKVKGQSIPKSLKNEINET